MSSPTSIVGGARGKSNRRSGLSVFPDVRPEWLQVTTPNMVRFLWERAAQQSNLHHGARALLMHIASRLFAGERSASIRLDQLSELVGKDASNVARTLIYLERHGFVHRQGGGQRVATIYWPMLPVDLVARLAVSADYPADRGHFADLLQERLLPEGAEPMAPDGTERPARPAGPVAPEPVSDVIEACPVRTRGRATSQDPPMPASRMLTSVAPDERRHGWVLSVLGETCRRLEMDSSPSFDGRLEADGLRRAYAGLQAKDRFEQRLLGLLSLPDGHNAVATFLASQRWSRVGPGALMKAVTDRWNEAGRPSDVPAGLPPCDRSVGPLPLDSLVTQTIEAMWETATGCRPTGTLRQLGVNVSGGGDATGITPNRMRASAAV